MEEFSFEEIYSVSPLLTLFAYSEEASQLSKLQRATSQEQEVKCQQRDIFPIVPRMS